MRFASLHLAVPEVWGEIRAGIHKPRIRTVFHRQEHSGYGWAARKRKVTVVS